MAGRQKPIVYNAGGTAKKQQQPQPQQQQKKKEKPGEKSKITSEHLDFLRTAEMLNEVDIDPDEFGGGLLAPDSRSTARKLGHSKKTRKKSSKKVHKKDGDEALPASSIPSSDELVEVAKEMHAVESSSTSTTDGEAKARPKHKRTAEDAHNDYLKPVKAGGKRMSAMEAQNLRIRLLKKRQRIDRCTYTSLVIIILIRLVTTLEMVYEYEEYGIVLEYLKRLKRLNCTEILEYPISDLYPWILCLYFLACCILPIIRRRELRNAFIVWFFFQMLYTGYRFVIFQKYFYHREVFITDLVILMFILHILLDVLTFTIVLIRYYFWANPCLERNRFSNTLLGDYLVNEYIQFIVQSSFIRKKNAVQRATAFQVMTVVRKLKEKHRSSGVGPTESAIAKEVKSAINALQDWKKFPSLRIIHSFEVKEKLMNEKLKQRRRRIRDMKERFHQMMHQLKQDDLAKARKAKAQAASSAPSQNKVFLNKKGQAIGYTKSTTKAPAQRPATPKGANYQEKRADAMQQIRQNK